MFAVTSRPWKLKIGILLHIRPMAPIATQSALHKAGSASLVFNCAANAAVGKQATKPSPAATALRAPSALSSTNASPNSRRRGVRLLHPQAKIGVGDLDAGAQQDALATALRSSGPYRFQHLLGFPEISGIVEASP